MSLRATNCAKRKMMLNTSPSIVPYTKMPRLKRNKRVWHDNVAHRAPLLHATTQEVISLTTSP